MVGDKYFLKCGKCGNDYEVLIGVLGNYTCRVCGNTQVTIHAQVVQKSPSQKRVAKNAGMGTD